MIRIIQADITTLSVDAIVNAANQRMLGGGGVDGAIHRAAGPELYEACLKVPEVQSGVRCPTGEARITPGFKLPAKFVIHTVGPVYRDGQHGEPEKLSACYRNSLALAAENDCKSIAFPCISTGIYGYPREEAAKIALREVKEFLVAKDAEELEVIFCCFSERDKSVYEGLVVKSCDSLRRHNDTGSGCHRQRGEPSDASRGRRGWRDSPCCRSTRLP
jgi:O-acetyl-ADP-ribose deacetylase (regulator of RNase III)